MSSWSLYYNTFFYFISTDITFLDQIKHVTRKQVWEGVNLHFQGVCFCSLLMGHHNLFIGLMWFVCKSERLKKHSLNMQKFRVSKFSFSYIFFLSICAFVTLDLSLYSEQMDELQSSGHEATSNHDYLYMEILPMPIFVAPLQFCRVPLIKKWR